MNRDLDPSERGSVAEQGGRRERVGSVVEEESGRNRAVLCGESEAPMSARGVGVEREPDPGVDGGTEQGQGPIDPAGSLKRIAVQLAQRPSTALRSLVLRIGLLLERPGSRP
jgi:hypothetical protein